MAQKYTIKILKKEDVAEGTMAFHFSKPEGFVFKAGQTIDLTLINPPLTDAEGNSRTFSIATSPSSGELVIATRMRDTAFKNSLKQLPEGTDVEMEGPFGSFTLPNSSERTIVFLTGGIGSTPVRSIVEDATERNLPHQIYFFYSNHTVYSTPFFEEFKTLSERNTNFHFVPTMTKLEEGSNWTGETGYVTEKMLKKYVPDVTNAIYFLSGPAAMVTSMRDLLTKMAIDEDYIRTEELPGY